MKELSTEYTIDFLCRNLGVTRQGYYLWLKNGSLIHKNFNPNFSKIIQKYYYKFKCVYGYKTLSLLIKKYEKIEIKPWVVYRYMKILNIKVPRKNKKT